MTYHFKKFDESKAPSTFLTQAEIILKMRGKEYGHFLELFANTSKRMSLATGKDINPYDVARIMIELKLSRLDNGEYKEDTIIDLINYCALAGSIKSHIVNDEKKVGDIDFNDILNKPLSKDD